MFLPVTFIVLLIVAACLYLGIWLLRRATRPDSRSREAMARPAPRGVRCSKCGQSEEGDAHFCGHCGARLT
ncbi:hypothetical protein RAS2_24800 [Phycisphaerae bacterium RAS2]|nr:hypothetical protein RAS2_24800 [Phycisphaerae bacterium RAS2]